MPDNTTKRTAAGISDLVRLVLWGILCTLLAGDIASTLALNHNFRARVEQTRATQSLIPDADAPTLPKECVP